MHHRSAVPPLPARLRPAPDDGSGAASPSPRCWTARLALRAAVPAVLTLLVVGGPVVPGHSSTSAVVDSSASSPVAPVESPVVMGQDGLGAEDAPPALPAPDAAAAEAPVTEAPAPPVAEPSAPATAPEPAAAAAPQPAAEAPGPRAEGQVLALVNTERAAAGCGALAADADLAAVARAHSADMRDRGFFDHVNPDGLDPFDRAARAGLTAVAENIAAGQQDPAEVMTAWMNSAGHRANILDCSLTRLGVGIAQGADGPWWTQLFG